MIEWSNQKKQAHIKFNMLEESKNNSRATWKIINQLIGKKQTKPSLFYISKWINDHR